MAQNHVTIKIRTDDPLAQIINNKLDKLNPLLENTDKPITIFRVPSYIRECHKNFYEPRLVSIGPYHRGREHLKCMEDEKLRYAKQFLSETTVPLEKYLDVLTGLEPAARRCYHEKINMDNDQFVEMLFIDACFIIQLVMNWTSQEVDILYDIGWSIPLIKSDILMLENQIPFFVLQRVFDLCMGIDDNYSLSSPSNSDLTSQDSELPKASLYFLLVSFLQHEKETPEPPEADQIFYHLLHFYYQYHMSTQKPSIKLRKKSPPLKMLTPRKVFPLISSSIKRITMRRRLQMIPKRKPRMIPCAAELKEAGISFEKTESKSIFHVNFSNGALTIPYTPIEEATRPQLMNLIAFEQCIGQKDKPLTSYAVFMDCIVNTPRDVLILQQHGIIENKLADEKAAAEFFNQLRYCTYLDYEEHHLAELFKNVNKYCGSSWQKYRAKLYRDYFSNPWSIISFLAAIVFLFLASVQTLYSVLSYYHSSNSQ